MKKKLLKVGGVILLVLLLCTLLAPELILILDKQEDVAESYAYSEVFYDEYEDVRAHLLETVDVLKEQGNDVPTAQFIF